MKKLINAMFMALFLIASSLNVSAQDLIPQQNKKGKWGYVDANGNKVIDYRYDEATAFLEGSAKVKKGDKWGYIGKDGKEVIKIQYTEMQPWDASGRSKVAVGGKLKDNVLSGAKWGYISRTGNVLLKPEYDEIGPFKDGVAHVVKGGKYGYIDESFNYVIECRYSAVGTFNSEGLCWIAQGGKLAGKKINGAKFGICNRRGEVIVKPEYTYIGTFVEEIPEANPVMSRILNSQEARDRVGQLAKDASKGMAGKGFAASFSGKNAVNEVIEEAKDRMRKVYSTFVCEMTEGAAPSQIRMIQESRSYDMLGYRFVEQELFSMLDMSRAPYFAVSKTKVAADKDAMWLIMARQIDKIGILDKYGKVLVKPGAYSVSFLPSEGLIPVVKANKKGFEVNYMQENGKLLMKKWVKADAVSPFVDGYAVIAAGQNQYLIDKMGQKVSSDYELILPPSASGHRIVKSAAGFGLVANKGNEILVPEWEMILPENNGLYCARKTAADKFGYINGDGAFEVQPLYDEARSFNGVTACVRTAAGWGVIDRTNKAVIDFKWDDIKPFDMEKSEICWVKTDNGWRGLEILSQNYAFDGAYVDAYNFNDAGYAYVSDALGMFGCIDRKGNTVIPMRMGHISLIEKCLTEMGENGKNSISDIEAYRFNLNNHPMRNGFRLSHTIGNDMWEY